MFKEEIAKYNACLVEYQEKIINLMNRAELPLTEELIKETHRIDISEESQSARADFFIATSHLSITKISST